MNATTATTRDINVEAPRSPAGREILSDEALAFVAGLARQFDGRRRELLRLRMERQAELDAGRMPDFPSETAAVREADWSIAPLPADLVRRLIPEELEKIRTLIGDERYRAGRFQLARRLFEELVTGAEFAEFLTTAAYRHLEPMKE